MKEEGWFSAQLIRGHGVASGRSVDSPYPSGTITMQRPFFLAEGLDLGDCWPGTLNLSVAPREIKFCDPDYCFHLLKWTELHPPETFSFWRIQLSTPQDGLVNGWIYRPHPETKQRHQQPSTMIEVLAPRVQGISPGCRLSLRDPLSRLRCVDGPRLRAQLLEFLKFRVLAAQDSFFNQTAGTTERRAWLNAHHCEALQLDDIDLDLVWNQARMLYTED